MTEININKLTAKSGWFWINEGVRYFIHGKYAWMMSLMFIGLLSVFVTTIAPFLQFSLIFLLPFLAAGLGIACAEIEKGKAMSIFFLFKAFTISNKLNLFRYGILLIILLIIAQIINSIILSLIGVNPEQLNEALIGLKDNKDATFEVLLQSPVLFKFMVTTFIVMIPVLVINLLAPNLLAFTNISAFEAIKLSIKAGIKNMAAFLTYVGVYILLLIILIFAFKLLIFLLIAIFGENSKIALLIYFFVFVFSMLAVASVSYSSAFVAYKDIFLEK